METSRIQNRPLTLFAIVAVAVLWRMAGWTQTLTTFQDGEPARASEVNDNFAALKAKIEALEQDLEALTPFQHHHVRLSHHINQIYATFNYSKHEDLAYGGSGPSDWQYAMTRSMVESVLTGFNDLLELTSTTHVKRCLTINLYLNLDYSVEVTSPDCEAIPLDLP